MDGSERVSRERTPAERRGDGTEPDGGAASEPRARLGAQELELLREVASGGPGSVAELVERFGAPRGLARSTVLTMMERLRLKGYLGRRREAGSYRYRARRGLGEVLGRLVERFVDGALGGSLTPLVAYLAEREEVAPEELEELERVVARLRARRSGP